MRKLTWDLIETGEIIVNDTEDMARINKCFEAEIEMIIDENNRIWNEGGQYIADIEANEED